MHVVGEEGTPVRGVRSRHRPVVAAADEGIVAETRRPDADRGAGESQGERVRFDQTRRSRRGPRLPQVDHLRSRYRGHRDRLTLDGRVPLGAYGSEEVSQRGRERLPHQAEHGLLPRLPALEVAVHGEGAEERVLVAPPHGLRAQGQVLEGRGTERGEARVRPGRVGGEEVPLVRPQRLHRPAGDEPGPDDAHLAVHLERGPAEERGELPGSAAPQQVHLEEAFLRVQEPGGPRHVEPAPSPDDGYPERIALDPHRRAEPRERALAFHLREARLQPGVEVGPAAARGERADGDRTPEDARPAAAAGVSESHQGADRLSSRGASSRACDEGSAVPADPSGPGRRTSLGMASSLAHRLSGHGLGGLLRRLGVAEVVVADWRQVVRQLVDERDARRDVEADDVVVRDPVEVLHERPEAVAVGGDEDALPVPEVGHDRVVPVRQEAGNRVLERLGERQQVLRETRVARVAAGMPLVVRGEGGRRRRVGAAPDLHLLLAELLRRLGLVEALERPVVPLVEAPAPLHRDPHEVHPLERDPERPDGPFQDRGVGHVEDVAALLQELRPGDRLLQTLRREVHVRPPREAVLEVPGALAVPQQDQLVHRRSLRCGGPL